MHDLLIHALVTEVLLVLDLDVILLIPLVHLDFLVAPFLHLHLLDLGRLSLRLLVELVLQSQQTGPVIALGRLGLLLLLRQQDVLTADVDAVLVDVFVNEQVLLGIS